MPPVVCAPVGQGEVSYRRSEPRGAPWSAGILRGAGREHRCRQKDLLLVRAGDVFDNGIIRVETGGGVGGVRVFSAYNFLDGGVFDMIVLTILTSPSTANPFLAVHILQVTKRAVCTPDFEQLYRRADEISGGGGGGGGSGGNGEGLDGGLQGTGSGVDDLGGPVKMEVA